MKRGWAAEKRQTQTLSWSSLSWYTSNFVIRNQTSFSLRWTIISPSSLTLMSLRPVLSTQAIIGYEQKRVYFPHPCPHTAITWWWSLLSVGVWGDSVVPIWYDHHHDGLYDRGRTRVWIGTTNGRRWYVFLFFGKNIFFFFDSRTRRRHIHNMGVNFFFFTNVIQFLISILQLAHTHTHIIYKDNDWACHR